MLDKITISIAGADYTIKKSYRSLMLFESKSGRSIDQMKESVNDLLLLFWCILTANNRETFKYTFDEFVDVLDEHPESVDMFNNFLMGEEGKVSEVPAGK
jgi:hypothetical protein